MYIIAKLPALYGRFHQLQEENYPFRRAFETYLETISRLGLTLSEGPERLIGMIENSLFEGDRLPDIPEGDQPIQFRFSIDNPVIEEYFGQSDLTNKMIVTLIIRMTLRLSEKYGNSLSRLTLLIEELMPEEEQAEERPKVRIAKPKQTEVPKVEHKPIQSESDVLERLSALTKKGDQLLEEEPEEEAETVVHTNPALSSFL